MENKFLRKNNTNINLLYSNLKFNKNANCILYFLFIRIFIIILVIIVAFILVQYK